LGLFKEGRGKKKKAIVQGDKRGCHQLICHCNCVREGERKWGEVESGRKKKSLLHFTSSAKGEG